ncbi:MAG: hypothetical protein A3B91_01420 [Candidatus Yanofskybacteria bacterium RIFCSPHIGHO2_02_FULL_41_29]|uniref:Uncharacterized protein n=1 Tax=Candidatus Yanofskybacteria bacterium RIFCSPHIGHO2_01_FULL_41_53 TaxID=1802663 RepID=A0A1F8EKD0_9BACT|nr:MAG: hypothetical protein A2650_04705 [Candidatus Yanofskybacteria bacterium RIFCSPHIGHO2_01_FULL_41_53]OGN12436.1 MAG: hypothetical protein A3B91_01420 [Candidatus Yanofskybacteria bacterium RIFCSPHIGHO2_02_FULL_41_29]OGN18682.1 MAG: hypothetical protein A3F48_02550 [Candidatus Yanofskybacteria bacterium RIFCSPHIGHO2_12_FULL_41_9]OGN24415.1 MAG: hypothetical protein A2916_04235 [Candidatus Yanofskybacteria bacterium RIFCSPLOWO2_01_FULL_41_67]OGN28648.1 MAG: hypothetical protein A3H54_01070 
MTKSYENPPEGPNEGKNRFYDKNNLDDEIAGLEFAINRTKHRIENDLDRPAGVLEEHLKSLEAELRLAKTKKEWQYKKAA